ncbi:MAG: hypothetical protein H0X62_13180, partial [Bacteroidetes bacterium]|nr:hypothetical protein [Bacteroidota bacterium]
MAGVKNKNIFILDVFPLIYRAHFAMINQSFRNSKGLNTAAILGFYNYLFQIIFQERPAYIAAAFDSRSLHRSIAFKAYKENRDSIPEDVLNALDYVRAVIDALHIKTIEAYGYEADDVIGTIAMQAVQKGLQVYIVSPDKDFAQLVSEHIFLYRPPYKGLNFEVLDRKGVIEKYGVKPEQIPDFLALKGDSADNIPGLPKIGDKTALKLLSAHHTLEEVLKHKDEQKGAILNSLTEHEQDAYLYKKVATIDINVALDFTLKEFSFKKPDTSKLAEILDELEFKKLKDRIISDRVFKKFFQKKEEDTSDAEKYHQPIKLEPITSTKEIENLAAAVMQHKKFYFLFSCPGDKASLFCSLKNKAFFLNFSLKDFPVPIQKLFENPAIEAVSYDIKAVYKKLSANGISFNCKIFDLKLAQYVLSPEENNALENIIAIYTGKAIDKNLPLETRLAMGSMLLERVYEEILKKIAPGKENNLLHQIEFPLIAVLARMEEVGVRFEKSVLEAISENLKEELLQAEEEIFSLAVERLNLQSPKQVSVLLSKMTDPKTAKKTKTGQVSTSEAVLIDLAENHPIAALLLRVRKINKLISTYTESLPKHINKKTGRIHPDFKQATTATGRLS